MDLSWVTALGFALVAYVEGKRRMEREVTQLEARIELLEHQQDATLGVLEGEYPEETAR